MSENLIFGQGWGWRLPELSGAVVSRLYGFTESSNDARPEKVILQTESHGNHSFYIAAGGFWDQLGDETLADVMEDYEGTRRVDYTERFRLAGRIVREVRCDWKEPGPLTIRIRLDRGAIELENEDCLSDASESVLRWRSASRAAAGV